MAPDDIDQLGIVQRFARTTGRVMQQELDSAKAELRGELAAGFAQHVANHHLPPRRTRRVTAVPFPDWELDDSLTAWAIERLAGDGWTLEEAAAALGVPALVLDMAMHDYWPHYQEFKAQRAYR